jgi:hypothetical protein
MTLVHGILFGGFFLMALFGVVVLMLRSCHEGAELNEDTIRGERRYLVGTVILGWLGVDALFGGPGGGCGLGRSVLSENDEGEDE